MIKRIVLISNSFPYGYGESFLEPEMAYVPDGIDYYIVPIHKYPNRLRDVSKNTKVVDLEQVESKKNIWIYFRSIFSVLFLHGVRELISCKKISIRSILALVSFIYSGRVLARRIKKCLLLSNIPVDSETIIYSYWMDSSAISAYVLSDKKAKVFCRTHGADLYDERTKYNHQFLRKFICTQFDGVFPISEQGKRYLERRTGCREKIHSSHLGVVDHGVQRYFENRSIKVISCSNVIHLKRIDLIISALSKLKNEKIQWVHFGDGELMEKIKETAAEKLESGTYQFFGRVSNSRIHDYYQNNSITLFVNASDTEGIPVSIMEAISYGIPVVATDVGGVSECVHNGINGILIPPDDADALANAILKILKLNHSDYYTLRKNARMVFEKEWNAKKNFSEFYNMMTQYGGN